MPRIPRAERTWRQTYAPTTAWLEPATGTAAAWYEPTMAATTTVTYPLNGYYPWYAYATGTNLTTTAVLQNACAEVYTYQVTTALTNPQDEAEVAAYEDALGEAYEETGRPPEGAVFDLWWQQIREERKRGTLERNRTFARWVTENPEPVREARVKRRERNYYRPRVTEDMIEAGFYRQIVQQTHGMGETVWWRIEVELDPEHLDRPPQPRAVRMRGRPSRREIRRYRRVMAEQEVRRVVARLERQRRYEEAQREYEEACVRARALLLANLTPQQREEYEDCGWFTIHVEAADGTHVYQVRKGHAGNVVRMSQDHRHVVRRYCIHPYGGAEPDEDVMLAQKLLLETNEAEFLRVANAS